MTGLVSNDGEDVVQSIRDLVLRMAWALVDQKELVEVEIVPDANGVLLVLAVASSDFGKIIGRQGRTARSLRTILGAVSMKSNQRFILDIRECAFANDK